MATVTTPAGETLEGVEGTLLDYYRGEGYTVTEEAESADEHPAGEAEPVVETVEVVEPVSPKPGTGQHAADEAN